MDTVDIERDGAVLTIRLNRPERMNAVVPELFADLSEALAAGGDAGIKAVILTGAGKGFCAGADIHEPRAALEPGSRRLRQLYHPAIAQLAALPKPVIAALNGPAVGAGLSLAMAADIRLASDRARLIPGFARVGLAPDNGASFHITRLLGYSRAFQWLCAGDEMPLAQALDWGLINEIVSHDELMTRSRQLAGELAAMPGSAVPATKRLLQQAVSGTLLQQLELEAAACDETTNDPDRLAARAALSRSIGGPGDQRDAATRRRSSDRASSAPPD